MTEDHFVKTVQRRFFLRGIRRVVQLPDAQHPSLPRNFSLDMDTAANHRSDPCFKRSKAVEGSQVIAACNFVPVPFSIS